MVEQVTAFKDSSGAVHLDEATAARAEAKLQLEKIFGGKAETCIAAIMQSPIRVYLALRDLSGILPWHEEGLNSAGELIGKTGQTLDERYPSRVDTTVQDIATGGDQ